MKYMDLTFLGHQTWFIGTDKTHILVDPILKSAFGHSTDITFTIWPPREIQLDDAPSIDAVILTHEHLDHFHLPSLALLNKGTPVYTGPLMPGVVVDAITALGLEVRVALPGEPVLIGDIEFQLFQAGSDTIFWEKRVTQVLVRKAGTSGGDVFIAVDALNSEAYLEGLAQGQCEPPRLMILSNNSQVVPPGALGAYTNLLPIPGEGRADESGLRVLDDLLVKLLDGIPQGHDVALCGNGFVTSLSPHGPFLYADNRRLAELANELQHSFKVYGPRPGECLEVESDDITLTRASWVIPNESLEGELMEKHRRFLASAPALATISPITPIAAANYQTDREVVEKELPGLARLLLLTDMGQLASSTTDYLQGPLGSQRLLFHFLTHDKPLQYAWDIARAEFVPVDIPLNEALRRYPFGLRTYLSDFAAVLRGDLQIWDLAGTAMESWYIGDSYSTVITALYFLYGEQMRPDLSARIYQRSLQLIGVASEAY